MWLETIENKLRSIFEDTLDRLLYPGVSRTLSSQLVALIMEQIEAQHEVEPRHWIVMERRQLADPVQLGIRVCEKDRIGESSPPVNVKRGQCALRHRPGTMGGGCRRT